MKSLRTVKAKEPKLDTPAPPYYPLTLRNFVCTAHLTSTLSLRAPQLVLIGSRWDAEKFPSCVSVCKNTGTTNSFFDTGEMLITGAPSVVEGLYATYFAVNKLNRDLNKDYQICDFKVENISYTFSLGYKLNLDMMFDDQEVNLEVDCTSVYDTDFFPGLAFRPRGGCVFMLFASGKGVLTGIKNVEEGTRIYNECLLVFVKYKLGAEYKAYTPSFKKTEKKQRTTKKKKKS